MKTNMVLILNNLNNLWSKYLKKTLFIVSFLFFFTKSYAQTTVSSIAELASVASQSGQTIIMTPGIYEMEDYLTTTVIANNTPADVYGRRAMLLFSGSNNTFDLSNVTINIDTKFLNDLGNSIVEFHLTGDDIIFKGLTVNDVGNEPTKSGGQSMTVSGDNITIQDVTLNMNGSSPYGYGDLFGKGGGGLTGMKKHSGMLIEGLNDSIKGCSIYSASFGHLFFVQGGRNVLFEDCYAEAVTRTTDDMLAETSGTAFDLNFESIYTNYDGDKVITPGYTKSLSEVGFRTYGTGYQGDLTEGVTLINCTAKNARVGFALEVGEPILIQNCEATGCESGYNLNGTGLVVENSRGDAVNGPLLYLNGDASEVELSLMTTLPTTILHAVATVAGNNHSVTLKKWNDETRLQDHSILVGATRPSGTNPFSPLGSTSASGITLNNCTEMPVEFLSTASSNKVYTNGSVTDNGTSNEIETSTCAEGLIDEEYDIAASSTDPDAFYGWDSDYSTTFGFMQIDETNDQLVCTFEDNGTGYVRFYWRKTDPSKHTVNSDSYPILAMKGKRPDNYNNFTLNLNNSSGNAVQFKDGSAAGGVETLSHSTILPGTTDVYYWDLSNMIPANETWELSGFNCVNTLEVNPISVMELDYLKTFESIDALNAYVASSAKTIPVAGKTYYIDNPYWDLRLGANGAEDAYTTSTSTTGANVEWVITASPTTDFYYIDCVGGGSVPRIRTDRSENTDMQATSSAGSWTKWEFTDAGDTTFHMTVLDNSDYQRLQVNNSGELKMVAETSDGTWETFTFTEVLNPSSTSSVINKIDESLINYDNESSLKTYYSSTLGQLVVKNLTSEYSQFTIHNVYGKLVRAGDVRNGVSELHIDVSDLTTGVYILRLNGNDIFKSIKVLKR